MDKLAVQDALDNAIADAGRAEFRRLAQGLTPQQLTANVAYALDQLRRLARGEMPNYNEWVTLFYGLWYQPKHINLAYRMIDVMAKGRNARNPVLTDSGALRVVDFGCGSFAMQFGVALAAASALSQRQRIESIKIDAIDSSDAMIRMGQSIWNNFVQAADEVANENHWLACLHHTCTIVETNILPTHPNNAVNNMIANTKEERWLSAIHAVYQANLTDVQQCLSILCNTVQPQAGFVTTFDRKIHLAHIASPFGNEIYNRRYLKIEGGLSGRLPVVTTLRQGILQALELSGGLRSHAVDVNLVRNYLKGIVDWQPSDVGYLIYTKR